MTRTMTIAAAVLLCAGVLPVARANCGPAPQPAFAIPDGAHASRDEMSAARDNLSEYSAQVAAYATCLGAEQADSGRSARTDAQRLRDRYLDLGLGSAALRQLASVVSCFTQQVQAFDQTGGGNDAGPAQCSRGAVTPP
jgi:predicted outer membrane protein